MKMRSKVAGVALATAAAIGVPAAQADAAEQRVRYGFSSWGACDKVRIDYFHDGAQTGGCKRVYIDNVYRGYGFVYWYR